MLKLDKALEGEIKKGSFNKHSKAMKIIFSGSQVPGEAEHKFLKDIANTRSEKICIFSNDGDLFMLGDRFVGKDIHILANPNATSDVVMRLYPNEKYILFSINRINDGFMNIIGDTFQNVGKFDRNRIIHDYIFFTMLGGNDFVHYLPFTKLKNKGVLSTFLRIYKKILIKTQDYLIEFNAQGKPSVNAHFFTNFIAELASIEDSAMKEKQRRINNPHSPAQQKHPLPPDTPAWKVIVIKLENEYWYKMANPLYSVYKDEFRKINYFKPESVWKRQYYQYFFGFKGTYEEMQPKINEVCCDYIRSLIFTLHYYLDELPSWTAFYPHRVAPFPSDILITLRSTRNLNKVIKFVKGTPVTPFQQLMMVLPPQNDILPASYRRLMTSPSSPIKQYYPAQFPLDVVAGGKYIYTEPILPEIDATKIIKATTAIRPKLSAIERKRDSLVPPPTV